jgi:hypothetical protein
MPGMTDGGKLGWQRRLGYESCNFPPHPRHRDHVAVGVPESPRLIGATTTPSAVSEMQGRDVYQRSHLMWQRPLRAGKLLERLPTWILRSIPGSSGFHRQPVHIERQEDVPGRQSLADRGASCHRRVIRDKQATAGIESSRTDRVNVSPHRAKALNIS